MPIPTDYVDAQKQLRNKIRSCSLSAGKIGTGKRSSCRPNTLTIQEKCCRFQNIRGDHSSPPTTMVDSGQEYALIINSCFWSLSLIIGYILHRKDNCSNIRFFFFLRHNFSENNDYK